jgi:dihydroorotase
MIDPHVHLRDWNQAHKETLRHGFSVAWRAGLDGVFEMPNTDPPLTSRPTIQRRIRDADSALRGLGIPLFHGLYAGLTADPLQIAEAVQAWREFFPRVVGLKMFAGHSTGDMGIVEREAQAGVYRTLAGLGFTGVLAVHCEKESMLRPEAWDPGRPSSHGRARPPAAEVASVDDQVELAREAGFGGNLHICHISTPWALNVLRGTHAPSLPETAPPRPLRVSCGLTPHHALLDIEMMDAPDGVLLKMNPPLRPRPLPEKMLGRLLAGDIDWIESDHAPHAMAEKRPAATAQASEPAPRPPASGIPVLPFYPRFVRMLSQRGMSAGRIEEVTHAAICRTFGISITNSRRAGRDDLAGEYGMDAFQGLGRR